MPDLVSRFWLYGVYNHAPARHQKPAHVLPNAEGSR